MLSLALFGRIQPRLVGSCGALPEPMAALLDAAMPGYVRTLAMMLLEHVTLRRLNLSWGALHLSWGALGRSWGGCSAAVA